ncbi:MAG: MlaA family lipoprotein [Marinomonadaceae bacterium]
MKKKITRIWAACFLSLLFGLSLSSCASKSPTTSNVEGAVKQEKTVPNDATGGSWAEDDGSLTDPADPWEGFNRSMFSFNDTVDAYFLKPIAKGYKSVTPTVVQSGVSNFFSNLGEISNITNNGLQAKKNGFVASTWRFLINSTVGVFGLFDVASSLGIRKYDEDFGQTLGYWGVSSGPYLVLPFLGPSTLRDAGGTAVDYFNYDPIDELDLNDEQRIARWAIYAVQKRASFLSAESLIVGDRYSFIRDVYLQNRVNEVYDGHPPQPAKQTSSDRADSWGNDDGGDSWGDDTDSWGDDSASDSWGDSNTTDSWGDSDDTASAPTTNSVSSVSQDAQVIVGQKASENAVKEIVSDEVADEIKLKATSGSSE